MNAARIGLISGPLVCALALLLPTPAGLATPGWHTAAVVLLMAIWWMTEALPLAATALVPLVLFPFATIAPFADVAANYAHPLIFLFLGGFMIAKSMERWSLHQRIALGVTRMCGDSPSAIIAGLMGATAFLSMWISNTASAMVMLPIAKSMATRLRAESAPEESDNPVPTPGNHSRPEPDGAAAALMLGVAYAATIGGMGTLVGTPPNALLVGFMQTSYGIHISFAGWMMLGIPLVLVLLPLTWLLLTRVIFRLPNRTHSPAASSPAFNVPPAPAQPMSPAQRRVAIIMLLTALAWVCSPLIVRLQPELPLSDAGIAVSAALLLFIVPCGMPGGGPLLTWQQAQSIRFDVLILFGGGLALADGISGTGLGAWIGQLLGAMACVPFVLLLLLVMFSIVYLGELASNTAIAAIFLPVAGAAAIGLGQPPLALALPVALAASLGFMLPVATPPNAIVYGSGELTAAQMLRAGALLDILATLLTAALAILIAPLVFPMSPALGQ